MPNPFDFNPRSPSLPRLIALGTCFVLVAVAASAAMVAKSKGSFDNLVRVTVELVNIGDGLPARSDVKFRSVLVGSVSGVTPSRHGGPNLVHVNLKPEYAERIPNTVTARVIPTNVFAVSAVQLVDNGPADGSLHSGSLVPEDTTLPTVLFQNVLAKLRELLAAVGRKPDSQTIGVMAALGEATKGRGDEITDTGHNLIEVLSRLNTVVGTDAATPSTISALHDAADGLRDSAPELFDALDNSIKPMRTFAEKRSQLTDFLGGGLNTTDTVGRALDNQVDRMITVTTQFSPPLGVIADHADQFHGVSTRLQVLANKFHDEAWDPQTNLLTLKAVVALTPSRTYVRADCPRYGELVGPSCYTAPETPTAPDLYPALDSVDASVPPYVTENRPNLTPPRHSMPGDPQGPPAPPVLPGMVPPLPPGSAQLPGPPPPGPPPPGPPAAAPASTDLPPSDAIPYSAVVGGNVGPVGSRQEAAQLARIVGGSPTAATQLLLGPVARGMTVHLMADAGGER
ncbi:MCE family protein [Mycobacterium sp. 1274756.6]|uniref:MlaD family protein n=1 Tax=Mycobacterium sp. 1274756.6 TaxID=1834076 RepID=UPI0007FF8845|nr:MCE family protein [Mycobacterium sp. 1274756.6]OBJ69441.1 mammalian cell entry protein [Mycobacterium sp. 1274756.6]